MSSTRATAIFGASDGLVASVALVLVTESRGPHIVLLAVLALVIAEGLGMAASDFLSKPEVGVRDACIMGVATSVAIVGPGVPWFFATGSAAMTATLIVAVLFAAVIAQLRPGGWATWLQTFGVLTAVAGIAAGAGHLG